MRDTLALLDRAIAGDRRSLARLVTWVESRHGGSSEALAQRTVRRRSEPGMPHVIGVTGPPGAGKSTFVDRWVTWGRARGQQVAVVAVDPSSPFSGGAILGDRIRMEQHTADDGVYIRSLSSRGHLGGLSTATSEVVDVFDVAGFDLVIVETVGVGQSELAVMEVADTVAILLTPESGDSVQAMKAGLIEIGDIFVVNKADRPGAHRLVRELELGVELSREPWAAPVIEAVAVDGRGIDETADAALEHLDWCRRDGLEVWRERRANGRERLALDLVAEAHRQRAATALSESGDLKALRAGTLSPYEAARRFR